MTAHDISLSRRNLLKGAGALVIGMSLPQAGRAQSGAAQVFKPGGATSFAPNAFVRIAADDTVTVLVKHIEFGQGPFTGLATLVAEELDADWAQMRAEHAVSDPKLYANLLFGIQGTGGSTAIANSYEQMRKAGATARAMLVQAAAETWKVPAAEISVEKGVLKHASGKQGRFGEFAEAASRLQAPAEVKLKDPAQFKLIGKEGATPRLDSLGKSTGKAQFTIDIHTPQMLTVVVARPPRFGGKVASFDATEAKKVKGVVDIKQIPSGVAVYATGTWPALKGREALKVTWDESGAEKRGSRELFAEYRKLARTEGTIAGKHGDAEAALSKAEKVIEAEYAFPYLAHAPMEPLDGYLEWNAQGALARLGSQLQTVDHMTIAKTLDLGPEKVTVETVLGGGSFGRRAQPNSELAAELAQVARAIGPNRPVKLVRTREDDLSGGYYRPLFLHRLRGAVKDGKITAWSASLVGQSFLKGSPFEAMIKDGIDPVMVEGANELPYEIADFRCELHTVDVGVPTLWWRSVGHTHTGYAVECFIDQLLQAAGQDPVAGRLALMGKQQRLANVLKAVADLAKWNGPGPVDGRARGVGVVESFGSYVAQIAEVSLGEGGEPKVHKVWCAVDCGVAVNPDIIRAQMEGGIGFGLGHALYGELTLDQGKPVQGNFDSYRSLRINEMPEVEVRIVPSTEKPTGVGEPGVPPIGPAVANALARLGRERPLSLPMVGGTV
ncbi:MAG: xanthine dehydrogenase family protein molybdopterin-binding subunit [Bosea sp.]|uniref:xanthine dehydrogenase family protein molybdopterin-binding subunit n=1 Tax=Bosea sp. (in: a-proteobacteria) TaxID=1871050 RepID=UPI00239C521D|nr:xanthine dehydrogenase family protein molybdopterin-binding subunit [Bosea sp. (in: a-proteobacteria)]MCP4732780.1 xanthine dehydrogenase family protein molybdopterin-binding subunit [Bosea sp. (in: a-proteobacteria)]